MDFCINTVDNLRKNKKGSHYWLDGFLHQQLNGYFVIESLETSWIRGESCILLKEADTMKSYKLYFTNVLSCSILDKIKFSKICKLPSNDGSKAIFSQNCDKYFFPCKGTYFENCRHDIIQVCIKGISQVIILVLWKEKGMLTIEKIT